MQSISRHGAVCDTEERVKLSPDDRTPGVAAVRHSVNKSDRRHTAGEASLSEQPDSPALRFDIPQLGLKTSREGRCRRGRTLGRSRG
jgi:hypothetical protein